MNEKQTRVDLEDSVIEVGKAIWAENSEGYPIIRKTNQYLTEIQKQRNIRDSRHNQ